jgi:phenylpropionate dioxygenase-like ring-hydroxylating dioxygenase large terminal subunit
MKSILQSDLYPFERPDYWKGVNRHVTQATTMPPEAFRSSAFYEVEQTKVFAATWQVAAFTDDLRNVGDVVTTTMAGQPIVLTKGRDEQIHGFFNVCRHRGARMVKETKLCHKKSLACPYHNWGYSIDDGRLLGTPLWGPDNRVSSDVQTQRLQASGTTEDVVNFDKAEYGLLPVRIQVWGPFVYVNISGDAPPLHEYLGRVTTDLALYPFEDFVTVQTQDLDVKANWKLLAENFMDFYHVPTVHPGYCDVSRFDDHDRSQGDGMYLCHVTYPLTKFFVVIIEPTSPTTSTEHVRLMVHKDSLDQAGDTADEALQAIWEAYSQVNREDFSICEECQIGANVVNYKGGRMTWTLEENINRFHKMVATCMTKNPHQPLTKDDIPQADTVLSAFDRIPIVNKDDGINDEKKKKSEED